MKRFAHVYVFDTLADWEPGYAVAELNSGRFFKDPEARVPVRTVGRTRDPVRTAGGLTVLPDATVDEVTPQNTALLLLPGGDTWLEPSHQSLIAKTRELLSAGTLVAAICGATIRLANEGLLDGRPHTSNDLGALKGMCPGYQGEAFYRAEPAVVDGNLITASGVAPLHFAHKILEKLDVMSAPALAAWFELNRDRKPEAFYALMNAVQPAQPG